MADAFADLRARLVREIVDRGAVRTPAIVAAFRDVPRHLFLPGLPPDEAYADLSIPVKMRDDVPISSSSQPAMMGEMLEQLDLRPGERVLEIGAGTGYNAALMARLTGASGFVATIDLDEDLVAAARAHLDAAGFPQVRVLCADGTRGDAEDAPFDALIATVAVGDVPPAWFAQLRCGGRLVMPLALGATQKIVRFERTVEGLHSTSIVDGGFMMLRGVSVSVDAPAVPLGEGTFIRLGNPSAIDAARLRDALRASAVEHAPLRAVDADEVWLSLAFWLAAHDDAFCRVTVSGAGAFTTRVPDLSGGLRGSPAAEASTLGFVDGGALVAFAPRDDGRVMLRAFGDADAVIARIQRAIIAWHEAGRPRNDRLRIDIVPRCADEEFLPAENTEEERRLVDFPSARALLRWTRAPAEGYQ